VKRREHGEKAWFIKGQAMAVDRRSFLHMSTLAGVSFFIPKFLSAACGDAGFSRKKLVVLQLTGGNDGLNTIVPFRNDIYYRSRPAIAIAKNKVLTLSGEVGLHPSLKNLYSLYQQGAVSVIQNVGYPAPHRSHHKCIQVWHSGSTDACTTGWLGKCRDHRNSKKLFNVDADCCFALKGERSEYLTSPSHSKASLAEKFGLIASTIRSASSPDIFYLSHEGYDTHVAQGEVHAGLLAELDESVGDFVSDLKRNGQFEDVLILTISEFGRRVAENEFGGTDHGTANCMFAISGGLREAGLHGTAPLLSDLDDGDLKHAIDFRQVYATTLERWLSIAPDAILSQSFTSLDFI
jgi:uncharacterized protein (DUF1501 family)